MRGKGGVNGCERGDTRGKVRGVVGLKQDKSEGKVGKICRESARNGGMTGKFEEGGALKVFFKKFL